MMLRNWRFYVALLVAYVLVFAWLTRDVWLRNIKWEKRVDGRVYDPDVLFKNPFEAIKGDAFPIVSTTEANEQIADTDLVLGVTINGESRGYSLSHLSGPEREIINDSLGGVPIAATW